MSFTNLIHANQLIHHRRYKDAEYSVKEYLRNNPHDGYALRLLAMAFMGQKRYYEAEEAITLAKSDNPNDPANYYVHGSIKSELGKHKEAAEIALEAIEMDPNDADFFGLLAHSRFNLREYQESLRAADKGLALDAEHQALRNIRAAALMRLDRADEAFDTIEGAIEDDPEDDDTHAVMGWALLEQGRQEEALEHFREALRLNPESQYAKSGLVEALKAKYLIYRGYLKYMFWLENQNAKVRWGVIIGGYVGFRILNSLSENNPTIKPFLIPIIVAYLLFAWSTWVIAPIFDLILFLNPYGRYALSEEETLTAKFVGTSLGIGLLSGLAYLFLAWDPLLMMTVLGFTMLIPLSSMLRPPKPKRKPLVIYSIALLAIGLTAIIAAAFGQAIESLNLIYLFGIFAYQWIANAIIAKQ